MSLVTSKEMFAKAYRGPTAIWANVSQNGTKTVDELYTQGPGNSPSFNNVYPGLHSIHFLSFSQNLQLSGQIRHFPSNVKLWEKQREQIGVLSSFKVQCSHLSPQYVHVFSEFKEYPGSQSKHSGLFVWWLYSQ